MHRSYQRERVISWLKTTDPDAERPIIPTTAMASTAETKPSAPARSAAARAIRAARNPAPPRSSAPEAAALWASSCSFWSCSCPRADSADCSGAAAAPLPCRRFQTSLPLRLLRQRTAGAATPTPASWTRPSPAARVRDSRRSRATVRTP